LRGSQLDRSTLRPEFEQLHQAWPGSGLARFGPTTPTRATRVADASVDPTEARWASLAQSDLNSLYVVLALRLPVCWSRWARGDKTLLEFIIAGQ